MSEDFSIVLIARNEEKTLPKLLESLEDFKKKGGETVLVDTGSTDKTIQIAKDWGCIIDEVGGRFSHTIDKELARKINKFFIVGGEKDVVKEGDTYFDFASARNYAASLASNNMVSFADADESFTKLEIDKIEQLIKEGYEQFEYYFVFSHDIWGEEAIKFIQCKFYDKSKMHWTGIVHEVLEGAAKRIFLDENIFKLEHFQNHETDRHSYLKGLAVDCYLHLEKDRNSHYFARELLWTGRPKSAIKEFTRHIAMDRWPAEKAQSMLFIGQAYGMMNQPDKQAEWYHKSFHNDSSRREALIELARFYKHNNNKQAAACYALASTIIPYNGFYASDANNYKDAPYEILYWAEGWLGNIDEAKKYILKALEYQPLNSQYLRDLRFYFALPKISVIIPTLGRKDGLKKCLASLSKINYPLELLEIIVIEDEPRIGVPKRLKEGVARSTGDFIVYGANDMEFTPDSIILAWREFQQNNNLILVSFNEGPLFADEGNICTHFMFKKSALSSIGGEIFDTEFNHMGVDNLLWAKCKALNGAKWCEGARIIHNHAAKIGNNDEIAQISNSMVAEDRALLVNKLKEIGDIPQSTLTQLKEKIINNQNFSFVKLGDGELTCMIPETKGVNCDGHSYSWELGSALQEAYKFLGTLPNVMITKWKLGMEAKRQEFEEVFGFKTTVDHDLLLNRVGELSQDHYNFWESIKNSKRRKIFIGPKRLDGVVNFLNIDEFVEVPTQNSWDMDGKLSITESKDKVLDNTIYLFSAGMPAKVWIADLLMDNPNITCLDCGSAFDPLFVGQTRTNQVEQKELQEFYKKLL